MSQTFFTGLENLNTGRQKQKTKRGRRNRKLVGSTDVIKSMSVNRNMTMANIDISSKHKLPGQGGED